MAKTLTQKIIEAHLLEGEWKSAEWGLKIDQTLTQDITGTMAYLQFEAIGLKRPKTELSLTYVDHNVTPTGQQNIEFLETFSDNYGLIFSPPGNGICHQLHLERFAEPGKTLLGSDSHTPTAGGIGAIACGAGGLDIAAAMAGKPFYLKKQKVLGVHLEGSLPPWVSAKDVILEVLRRLTVKGGVGKIIEYFGPGVATLTVSQRGTICNMGAELGATCSVFPSDEQTLTFLTSQQRGHSFRPLLADDGAEYDELVQINLSELEPLIALPSMPDLVKPVRSVEGTPVKQVIIGSCTNSSFHDLFVAASVLKDRTVHPEVELLINPGSKQVLSSLDSIGLLAVLHKSQLKICESACLGCIGMGQNPLPAQASLRTFNRNFKGRSGTADDQVYLCSPETAIAAAINGCITDPRNLGDYPRLDCQQEISTSSLTFFYPSFNKEIKRGEMIAPLPIREACSDNITGRVLIKLGDNITTDDIMPAGEKIVPLRSHIPRISEYVFHNIDRTFAQRAKEANGGVIVGGNNYGQGSSREHAAFAPMYLGIQAVIVKSFARIHKANLINFGILPLTFGEPDGYNKIAQGDLIELSDVRKRLEAGLPIVATNVDTNQEIPLSYDLSQREISVILAGGLLSYIKNA